MNLSGFQKIKLLYEGKITIDNTEDMLVFIKQCFEDILGEKRSSRSLRVAVEILQNIAKHNDNNVGYDSCFILYKENDNWCFMTKNMLNQEDKVRIETIYDSIKGYDEEQLKFAYRQGLTTASINEKGGAGLGLIDIAYRTKMIPQFTIFPLEGTDKYEFSLQVNLNLN
jgi:Family of unknown function (DUF6272)